MDDSVYPKLVRMDVATNLLLTKEDEEFGGSIYFDGISLTISDEDPPRDYIFSFIHALALNAAPGELKYPQSSLKASAENLGKQAFTWTEYMASLVALGIDVEKLHAQAVEVCDRGRRDRSNSKEKAAAFFELLKTKWFVTDAEVREHIDASSIYDLLELALKHSDTAKARITVFNRHTENRAMKANVFVWLDTNMAKFKSMDAAAEAVANQNPIAFRTARDWVGEWKKLPSTGRP